MTTEAHPLQPQPPSRQRLLDEVNALADYARAQSDAAKSARRNNLFSPRAHLRVLMLGQTLKVLAMLMAIFAAPAQSGEPDQSGQPTAPDQPDQTTLHQTQPDNLQHPAWPPASAHRVLPAPAAIPGRRHALGPRAHHTGAASRSVTPPQRAGAAPNPIPASGARHPAPHRRRTPGAATRRPPQRLQSATPAP